MLGELVRRVSESGGTITDNFEIIFMNEVSSDKFVERNYEGMCKRQAC